MIRIINNNIIKIKIKNNINKFYNCCYYSKSNDFEIMIESDNNQLLNNNNKKSTIETIIKSYSNDYNKFKNHLIENKPLGKDLYQYMILSRATFNDKDILPNQFHQIFNNYLNNNIINNNKPKIDKETLEFILEFYSKSLNGIEKIFSILFSKDEPLLLFTSNEYSYIFDSIILIQNKLLVNQQDIIKIKPLLYKFIDSIIQFLKINSISLNIGNYNKILEIYSNFNDKNSIVKTLEEDMYLSFIKPDMNTYMLVFPYLDSNQSSQLMSKIKGTSNFKSGLNTYQILNEQFEKLLESENKKK